MAAGHTHFKFYLRGAWDGIELRSTGDRPTSEPLYMHRENQGVAISYFQISRPPSDRTTASSSWLTDAWRCPADAHRITDQKPYISLKTRMTSGDVWPATLWLINDAQLNFFPSFPNVGRHRFSQRSVALIQSVRCLCTCYISRNNWCMVLEKNNLAKHYFEKVGNVFLFATLYFVGLFLL